MGKRESKTDEEIVYQLKNKAYQPQNDKLMPRIAKKFRPMMSQDGSSKSKSLIRPNGLSSTGSYGILQSGR